MIKRCVMALWFAWPYRDQLGRWQERGVKGLLDVDCDRLFNQDVKALVLDFDGVLSAHGELSVQANLFDWLNKACRTFENNVFILSNNPYVKRQQFLQERFPEISFIVGKRKKPYPDGLFAIIDETGHLPKEVMLVDDRLLTGALAASMADTQFLYVRKPLSSFIRRPISETWFALLRVFERSLIWMIG